MAEKREITCDACGTDLTWTGNCEDYRLALLPQRIPSRGGFVTAMGVYPDLDRPHHFCNWKCLRNWFLDREESVAPLSSQQRGDDTGS